jgi:hypothetical protein
MTSTEWFDSDESLLAELADALAGPGPAPQRMVDAARAAFAWRAVDEELEMLLLAYDSAVEDATVTRDARPLTTRTLVFEGDGLSLEVELGDGLAGQLIPPQAGRVVVFGPGETVVDAAADSTGCFRLARPGSGPIRFRCESAHGTWATDWLTL